MSSNQNIPTKICIYGCGLNLYWNTSANEYWEVFTKKKHICPNRGKKSSGTTTTITAGITPPSTAPKPTYYKKSYSSYSNQQPTKPKMSNSFELLTGPIETIQKKYEMLSDIVIVEHNGKVHGSQRDRDPKTGLIEILVYYEVPLGQREEVKRKFNDFVLLSIITRTN